MENPPAKRLPRPAGVALGLVALGVAGAALLPFGVAWAFLHPPRRLPARTPRSLLGLPYTRVWLRADDGVRLAAWYVPAPHPRGVAVVCHGFTNNRATMLPYVALLNANGWSALMLEFRAHGWSGGRMATFGARETGDVRAALDWTDAQEELDGLPRILVGESMGAAVSLLAAAEHSRVRAVVADSPYARFDHAVQSRLSMAFGPRAGGLVRPHIQRTGERFLGVRCETIAPVEAAVRLTCPVLLVQGQEDTLVLPFNARLIHEANPDHIMLWEVPGARHARAIYTAPDEYTRRLGDFLNAI